jgi:tetratricopeptide (TPR) repeat protein
MELLRSLVAKSLVDVIGNDEVARYRLLESVRLYAEGKLVETGESAQLRSIHRDFYLESVENLPGHAGQTSNTTAGRGAGFARVLGVYVMSEADNLTAALEWCRQQGRYDFCARIASRMTPYWHPFFRLSEMMAWWRDLDAGLPAEDRDHRAMAFLLRSEAALLAGEMEELNVCSAQASALAGPHRWIDARAHFSQAMYWSMIDPLRSERHFQRSVEIEASMGWSPDPGAYLFLYGTRLLRTNYREEALALLSDWLADLGGSTPSPHMVGIFALYGDTRRALELKSRALPFRTPVGRLMAELSEAVLASAQGQFDEAEQHLAAAASVERDFAVLRGDAFCLIGFAKVALDRGDYVRAARLLAVVDISRGPEDRPFLSPLDGLVRLHCTRVLGDVLDPETARTTQAEGAALSLKEALDAELIRSDRTVTANPAD